MQINSSDKLDEKNRALDAFMNAATGIGQKGIDKRMSARHIYSPLKANEALELYASSEFAARIVDKLPDEATREGINILVDDPKPFQEFLNNLNAVEITNQTWKEARICGTSAIFLNADDGKDLEQEFSLDSDYELKSIVTFDYQDFEADIASVSTDLSSPLWGKPTQYIHKSNNKEIKIHESRLILFHGSILPLRLHISNKYKHQSVLERPQDAIRDYTSAYSHIANVVQEYRLLVLKLKNLEQIIQAGHEDLIKKRIEALNYARNMLGAWVMSQEEDATFLGSGSLAGLPECLNKIKERLQASVDGIPHNILFNESPGAALSGQGGAQKGTWYDYVSSQQETYLRPRISKLLHVAFGATNAPKKLDSINFEFNPLFQQSSAEEIENQKKKAELFKTLIESGILHESEAFNLVKEDFNIEGEWIGSDDNDDDELPLN